MDTKRSSNIRVLMLPWLAHGHISPFIELAKKLTKRNRNFTVFLCSTPINLSSVKKRITEKYSLHIKLVQLHLPSSRELPHHYHTTNGLPSRLMPVLKASLKHSAPASFSTILQTTTPHFVIYDFNMPWAPDIAASYNIPAVEFVTVGVGMVALGLHMSKNPGVEFPFSEIQLRGFHAEQFHRLCDSALKEGDDGEGAMDAMKKSCKIILFNSIRELEGKYIDYLSVLAEKKVVPVGPLVQEIDVEENEQSEIIEWLDKKAESSTVFVSFGSECFLTKAEMEEVAHGLELSKVNFIWVVRFPLGEEAAIQEALPEGFLERIGERGLVVRGWAPQAKILTHSSTGGFVSHCGWNSSMESLKFGVPVIAVPMHLDQPSNARLLEAVGVAVEVQREEDGRLKREEIARVIRKVVVEEEDGEEIRSKAKDFREKIKMKGEEEIDDLVEEVLQLCEEWGIN